VTDADRPVGPVIVRRRLGHELRRLREEADLRLDAVAEELEISTAKLSRLENGLSPAKIWDVRNLLTLYGVDGERRDDLLTWAREARTPAWWQAEVAEAPAHLDYFLSLEAEASTVLAYSTPSAPALLQTEDYARAHIATILPDWSRAAVDRLVRVRLGRQEVLRRDVAPLHLRVIVDEAALLRPVGSPELMRDQLRALLTPPSSVELRVLPFAAGVHGAITAPFVIFLPRSSVDPVVVAREGSMMDDTYADRPGDTEPYRRAFDELWAACPTEEGSRAIIDALVRGPEV
jgi:transcriptional regulator with XRE-family HTH domain